MRRTKAAPKKNPNPEPSNKREIETRGLLTITPKNRLWEVVGETTNPIVNVENTLVRLQPPHYANDALVALVKRKLKEAGAASVRAWPKAPEPKSFGEQSLQEPEGPSIVPALNTVIDRMVETSFSEDKPALRELIDGCLAKAEERKHRGSVVMVDPGHVVGIRLHNWQCYEGEQVIEGLQPITYSVTASLDEDSERSNFLGKSAILKAIVFALTNDAPGKNADDWITDGCNEGGVDLEFSEDLFVSRFKTRGKGVRVEVAYKGQVMTGKEAEHFLSESVVDKERLHKTTYFEQKKTDQFVTMGAAERSSTVNRWLGLDWVEDAAALCRERLNKLCTEEEHLVGKLEDLGKKFGDIDEELKKAGDECIEATEAYESLKAEQEADQARDEERRTWREQTKIAGELEQLETRLNQLPNPKAISQETIAKASDDSDEAGRKAATAEAAYNEAKKKHTQAVALVKGQFNGKCPVAPIDCPATKQINSLGEPARKRAEETREALDKAKAEWESAKAEHSKVKEHAKSLLLANSTAADAIGKREYLKTEIVKAKAAKKWLAGNPEPPALNTDLRANVEKALIRRTEAVSRETSLTDAQNERTVIQAALEMLGPKLAVHRQAMAILGRSGAQRVVAEGALEQIEREGNQAIARAGIGLQFQVRWSRETKELATSCDSCGSAFPKSAKIKECARCGTERGKKLSNELTIGLSNVSGGAEDLAGVMFKLAASHWLQAYEGGHFGVYLLDEIFGALDRAHVKRLGQHLGNLLGGQFGARQAFIVAHDSTILEGTPGRIHITSSNGRSTIALL